MKLRFTDKQIERLNIPEQEFSYIDKNGKPKFRERLRIPFDITKQSVLKGLKLVVFRPGKRKLNTKLFELSYWFDGKSHKLPLGKFIPGVFGCKELEEYLTPIVDAHTNKKRHWTKNPLTTQKESERVIKKEDIKAVERKTVNEVIEALMSENMPKIASEGTLCAKSIREQSRFLIGYNKRTRFLSYSDDEDGNGRIT